MSAAETKIAVQVHRSRHLYEITPDVEAMIGRMEEAAEANDGVIPDEIDAEFDAVKGELVEKLDSCAIILSTHGALIDRLKTEAARLTEWKRTVENERNRLKGYVQHNMERMGVMKSEGQRFKLTIQNNPKSVQITSEVDVPAEYREVTVTVSLERWNSLCEQIPVGELAAMKITHTVRKKDILAAHKESGGAVDVPGTVVTQTRSLRIK